MNRYGIERIRQGLMHFLLGKGVTAIAGVLTLVLIVRGLSVGEFAAYSALGAFVEIFTALAGFGLTHIALRYVPELHAQHRDNALRRLVVGTVGLRTATLLVAIGVAYVSGQSLVAFFNLEAWLSAFRWFLLAAFVRISFHFVFQILEAMLRQRIAQAGFVISGLTKLLLVAVLSVDNSLSLLRLIAIEAVADLLGLVVVVVGLVRCCGETGSGDDGVGWVRGNLRRVTRFGLTGYLQHLAVLLYGSSPNRLVGARYLDAGSMASMGFAQSLIDVFRRYLPAQLLIGLVRPVLLARYAQHGDFGDLVRVTNLVFKVNFVLLGIPIVLVMVCGEPILLLVSGGKYGEAAKWVLLGFLIVLVLESFRLLLDVLVQAVERFGILMYSNLILSASLLIAVPLLPLMGGVAIALANLLGIATANAVVTRRLGKYGHRYCHDWWAVVKYTAITLVSIFAGLVVQRLGGHWMIQGLVALACYLLCTYKLNVVRMEEVRSLLAIRKS